VKEKPILFSTPMVQAILEGRKTQTRRVIKPQPPDDRYIISTLVNTTDRDKRKYEGKNSWVIYDPLHQQITHNQGIYFSFPYQVGDRLWVKETHYRYGKWIKNGLTKTGKQKWLFKALGDEVLFFDNPPENIKPNSYRKEAWYKRSSLFLPKKYARIWLEVTGVRAERLQEITEEDAIAEGIGSGFQMNAGYPDYQYIKNGVCELTQDTAVMSFASLWDSINGKKYPWSSNFWVWVYEFKRITK